jgi:uncharacterized protein
MTDKYNAHVHVFTGKCAPKDFLQVATSLGDGVARVIKWTFLTRPGTWLVKKLANPIHNRMIQFLKIGVMASQQEVFLNSVKNYDGFPQYSGIKFIGLTIDMDYMSTENNKPTTDFNAQINEVVEIKKCMPDRFFPFYGVDPRNPDSLDLEKIKYYIHSKIFSGIKLYPPNGFFPFDERLDALYEFAALNNVPIMTHCTRSGTFYIGNNVWSLIPDNPTSVNPNHQAMTAIKERIKLYKESNDASVEENKRICNLFSHPQNYLPVLDKYPNLKLCLAHLGGVTEILATQNPNTKDARLYDKILDLEKGTYSWYELIRNVILKEYSNTYADISYSLFSLDALKKINADMGSGLLAPDRILFGTDYFMVEQENDEMSIVEKAVNELPNFIQTMMSTNIQNYLYK